MKDVFTTTQYRRDFKRYKGEVKKLKALEHIVDMLRRGEPLPQMLGSICCTASMKDVWNVMWEEIFCLFG